MPSSAASMRTAGRRSPGRSWPAAIAVSMRTAMVAAPAPGSIDCTSEYFIMYYNIRRVRLRARGARRRAPAPPGGDVPGTASGGDMPRGQTPRRSPRERGPEHGLRGSSRRERGPRGGLGLSRQLWIVQAGIFLNALGWGAVLPFEIIYLHSGRGFSLGVAGLVIGVVTGLAVVASPAAGPVIDRVGARATAVGGGVALAAGYAGLAAAHQPWQAFAAAAVAGTGNGALQPSQSALLASLAPGGLRHRLIAVSRVATNRSGPALPPRSRRCSLTA